MTSFQHRLFIDECLPIALIRFYLAKHLEIAEPPVEVMHYVHKFGPKGKWKDCDFIPELARDKRWIILSGDHGAQSTEFESMRYLCRQNKVTLVWLSTKVSDRGLAFYGPQVLSHWDGIVAAAKGPRGAQYHIHVSPHRVTHTILETKECPKGYKLEKGACVSRR